MTRKEKRAFVHALTRAITKAVIREVPKMPESWDGYELRELLAAAFERERVSAMRNPRRHGFTRRVRDYHSSVYNFNINV